MNFAFTEDQVDIAQAARTMLIESCTPSDLRRLLAEQRVIDAVRWDTIKSIGLLALLAPEDAGGLGLKLIDFIGVAEAAGYVALPEPLVEQAGLIIPILSTFKDREPLTRALRGEIIALSHPATPFVLNADAAEFIVMAGDDGVELLARDAARLDIEQSVDPLRRLFRVTRIAEKNLAESAPLRHIARQGAILAAAQLLGLAQRCIDLAVEYAKGRVQFGKPIGSYQAVKHLLATAQVKIEFARPVVHAAAAEIHHDNSAAQARASHAKLAAGTAADLAARTAVQVHGAMGITWEVDVHFFLKRALALNYSWGTPATHQQIVMERLRNTPTGPATTFASSLSSLA